MNSLVKTVEAAEEKRRKQSGIPHYRDISCEVKAYHSIELAKSGPRM